METLTFNDLKFYDHPYGTEGLMAVAEFPNDITIWIERYTVPFLTLGHQWGSWTRTDQEWQLTAFETTKGPYRFFFKTGYLTATEVTAHIKRIQKIKTSILGSKINHHQ